VLTLAWGGGGGSLGQRNGFPQPPAFGNGVGAGEKEVGTKRNVISWRCGDRDLRKIIREGRRKVLKRLVRSDIYCVHRRIFREHKESVFGWIIRKGAGRVFRRILIEATRRSY
jgi:hypothetical protein